ncbi:unnamed protein product [Coffea canephora]|uniref:Uncharacterized protein n=1 Tax=Coffea canephora TaxID=49390 RepID=A0A068UI47_COFCA|nr:unnamed protein product [Coffea canephora]
MYRKPEAELHSGPRSIPRISAPTVGPSIAPPLPVQAPYFQPLNFPPNSSWDMRGLNNHMPRNPISPREQSDGSGSDPEHRGILLPGGHLVKLLESEDVKDFSHICKPLFKKAIWLRPKATRSCSKEIKKLDL